MTQLQLTDTQLHYLMGIGTVVSKDTARPTLRGVQLITDVAAQQLTAVATDSYQLAVMRLSNVAIKGDDETWYVPFHDLERAARFAKQQFKSEFDGQKATMNKFRFLLDTGSVDRGGSPLRVDLSYAPNRTGESLRIPVRCVDTRFPNWKQLFKGRSWWGRDLVGPDAEGRVGFEGMKLPNFNSQLLSGLPRLLGGGASYRLGIVTQNFIGDSDTDTSLQPWLFGAVDRVHSPTVEVAYLLMPVTDNGWDKANGRS